MIPSIVALAVRGTLDHADAKRGENAVQQLDVMIDRDVAITVKVSAQREGNELHVGMHFVLPLPAKSA